MQQDEGTGTVSLSAVKGAPDRVLVKFNFTNPKHIPAGIPEKAREGDKEVDSQHAIWAAVNGMAEKAQVSRKREERVDSGEHVIDNLLNVQVAALRSGFANNDFVIADAHWFRHQPNKRAGQSHSPKPKFVVCLTYRAVEPSEKIPKLLRKTVEALRELANTTWKYCHVWNNPDGCATVNMVGRSWNDKEQCYDTPQNAIVVRDKTLKAIAVETSVSEDEENETE